MAFRQETLGDFLHSLGVYDPQTKQITFDADELTPLSIRRIALPIEGNMIKQWMLEDVLRGALLPAKAIYETSKGRKILDGLQRTDVEARALDYLLRYEGGDLSSIPIFAQKIIQKVGRSLLRSEEYLQQSVFLQLWRNLDESNVYPQEDEVLRLFMVLNIGQQRMVSRDPLDTLDILFPYLYQLFKRWGIIITRGDRISRLVAEYELYSFRYLVGGAIAYADGTPHIAYGATKLTSGWYDVTETLIFLVRTQNKRKSVVGQQTIDPSFFLNQQQLFKERQDIVDLVYRKLKDISNEDAYHDFTWVCKELNREITRIYKQHRKWHTAIIASDNFFLPLMAALGKARQEKVEKLEQHKQEILELLRAASPQTDPLQFFSPPDRCLESTQKQVRSNIGRTYRAIVYKAWLTYFRQGRAAPTMVLDWQEALRKRKE